MRPSWDDYFRVIAIDVSSRATCPRAHVGAVIVSDDNRILATGYNGSPPGEPHCIDDGCVMEDGHCQRALHAEVNAIAHAAKAGIPVGGSRLYLYGSNGYREPCRECFKVLKAAAVRFVLSE